MNKSISDRVIDLYMTVIGYIDIDPEITNEEIGRRLELGSETIANYKSVIKKIGWLTTSGTKGKCAPYHLTDEGRKIFEEYDCSVKLETLKIREERVKDRRMSVLGYLSFDFELITKDIADILQVSRTMINNDIRHLKNNKLVAKSGTVSKLGLETLDNYECDLY